MSQEPATPMIEQTAAGAQAVIEGAERRTIPDSKLQPKRAQRETLTPLEGAEVDSKQSTLF